MKIYELAPNGDLVLVAAGHPRLILSSAITLALVKPAGAVKGPGDQDERGPGAPPPSDGGDA